MAMARHALGEKHVNKAAGHDGQKKIEVAGARWEVKGDADLDDIAALLGDLTISAKPEQGPTNASAAAQKVLDSDKARLKDTKGKAVELVKVTDPRAVSEDDVDEVAEEFSDMVLTAKAGKVLQGKSNRRDVPNPLQEVGRTAESYIDTAVKSSDMWKSLSVQKQSRLRKMLAHAVSVATKREARQILDSMFLMAGDDNEARMRDMLPWVTGEF